MLDRYEEIWSAQRVVPYLSRGTFASLKKWLRGRDLNPRPLGYEPNELPDCSTPRQRKTDYIRLSPRTDLDLLEAEPFQERRQRRRRVRGSGRQDSSVERGLANLAFCLFANL
jgi:hypothetical protein